MVVTRLTQIGQMMCQHLCIGELHSPSYCQQILHLLPNLTTDKSSAVSCSLVRPIETTNKGHQLLKKLGWQDGDGLGQKSSGRKEPVSRTRALYEQCQGTSGKGGVVLCSLPLVRKRFLLSSKGNPNGEVLKRRVAYEVAFSSVLSSVLCSATTALLTLYQLHTLFSH